MEALILDCEASGAVRNKGHPFDPRNKLCLIGVADAVHMGIYDIEYTEQPYGQSLLSIQSAINEAELIVGCNLKYDLHWLRRYGIILPAKLKIWDCQYAHFILTAQRQRYPSMNDMAIRYDLPMKPEKIKEYWDNDVDTDQIPLDELTAYLEHDLSTTEAIYQRQLQELEEAGLLPLFRLCMQDTLVLEEMEWNGMKYDKKKSLERAADLRGSISEIVSRLNELSGIAGVNWESPKQVSAVLYGGTIEKKIKVQEGVYKSGLKAGQPRYRNGVESINCVQLIKPAKGTELGSDDPPTQFSTEADVLRQLPAKGKGKEIITLLLELAKQYQLVGTYYEGIPQKFEEFGWEDGIIHHNLNQSVVVTGRLSSSNPNLQNQDKQVRECFITRYEDS